MKNETGLLTGPLSAAEYERIYRVLHATLDPIARTHVACLAFAVGGAALLNKHHGIEAAAVAGAAVYYVDTRRNFAATFGHFVNHRLASSPKHFHCWIETKSHAIDFMAPIFRESMASAGHPFAVPRRMFQRALSAMATSLDDLGNEGDFALQPDRSMTARLIDDFFEREDRVDWLTACLNWYRPLPLALPLMKLRDSDGSERVITLDDAPMIEGAW